MDRFEDNRKLTFEDYDRIIQRTVEPISKDRREKIRKSAEKVRLEAPKIRVGNIFKE